ncbi:cytochrome c1 [Castellaniella hirudinis]|uniref:cytochrome c1 n=1 Tax=Castellaniella hirudinis TaxID=1144617 RepID=UPI0039C46194
MIKKLLGALALSLISTFAFAEGGAPLDHAPNRITDLAALQNGAKLFVNYCLNCHSANAMRYNNLTEIGLTEAEIKKNLLFSRDKVGDLMTISMTPAQGKAWFGTTPPDLSLITRAKNTSFGPSGVDYVYSYLLGFYRDTAQKTGWNNTVFPTVAMPNVLWELEGPRTYTDVQVHEVTDDQGKAQWTRTTKTYDHAGFVTVKHETLDNYTGGTSHAGHFQAADEKTFDAFKSDVADLSNFLGWVAEPQQTLRKQIGAVVLLFLFLFLFVAIRMNRAYWKHVR